MKGNEQQLVEFLENNKRFCIPLYQRNYDWKEGNCRQLFSDLLRIHEDGSKSHFFGSIVYSQSEANGDERLIIDGQQRITTVSLILIAMINAAKSDELPSEDKDYYIQNVSERFLIDKWRKTERKVKLKPIKKDMEAFDALLFKSPEEFIMDSVVTRNYLFFYDEVKKCGLKLEEILEAINKLEIISIWLGKDDDPQLIFESLNSTGLDLSESDKIRNNLLMSLNSKEQEEAYDKYWNKIEIATAYQPTMFIRDYLTIKSKANKVAKIENLYFEFKTYSSESGLSKMEQMADMFKYAIQYDKIQKADLGDSVLNKLLRQLSYIDTQQYMPFLVQFFIYAEESGMPLADRHTVVQTIECYMARRIICGLPANALNKVFASLHSDIMKHIKEFEKHDEPFVSSYPEVLKYVLIRKQGNSELPSDNKVAEEMRVRNVYKMPLAYRYFMFERMN
ncbi:MAG: DUF262 domain-containing protein, partial [Bacteroidales bacterium]|nr:DUF262 domain-containing protein [Bacteroidales bacterium]